MIGLPPKPFRPRPRWRLALACLIGIGLLARHHPVRWLAAPSPSLSWPSLSWPADSWPVFSWRHVLPPGPWTLGGTGQGEAGQGAAAGPVEAPGGQVDFGGHMVRGGGTMLRLGGTGGGFWAGLWGAPPAQAPACLGLTPPALAPARAPTKISADVPGLYGAPWVGTFGGVLVAVLHVVVPRQSAAVPAPVLQVYGKGAAAPVFSAPVPVSVTRGREALLYRIFGRGPVSCIDFLIPNGAGSGTAYLYYPRHGRMFEATGTVAVQR